MSATKRLLARFNIDETFTKPPKVVFDSVKANTFPMGGYNYMADVLYLPTTKKKYKYLLTMIDIWSNNIDFEPIKDKQSKTVLDAMKTIFKRDIMPKPQASIRTDGGSEFKDVFHKYLHDESILHRVSEPYRHNQTANVERLNRTLGRFLNGYMNAKEVETGKVFREWTDIIDELREGLNNATIKLDDEDPYSVAFPKVKTSSKYKVGDSVYYKSEVPLNALNGKQNTKQFRTGDIRYNLNAKKIKSIVYYPKNVRYILSGKPNVSYAESELLTAA